VRVAALLRLGRSLRKAGRTGEALDAYAELATLDSTPELGLPAALVAREARCSALAEAGRNDDLKGEAAALLRDLEDGRWQLSRSAYEFRASEARRWIGDGARPPPPAEALALSATVSNLVDEWRARPGNSSGRRVFVVDSQAVLAAWRGTPTRLTAALGGVEYLRAVWNEAVPDRKRTRLALTDAQGRTVFGAPPGPSGRGAVRTAAVTNLPWTLHVSAADPSALVPGVTARRRLLLAGLSILALLLLITSYFIVRAMTRELAVARLQSDFVASVSHEFRSPLTSMRQLSSMLVQGRLPSDEQRQRSYEFLADETGRLDRLIEGLLDFGLMEAGEARYRLRSTDAVELVRDTVTAFQRTVTARGYQVELSLPASSSGDTADRRAVRYFILADEDALGRAIWNLLDNAVKFSPDERHVWVDVVPLHEKARARLAIVVKDRGMGIPATEHGTIFDRFVRGAASREAGIKGTGIGLAMVKHIVDAHGGSLRLESAPGEGSTFSIVLPAGAVGLYVLVRRDWALVLRLEMLRGGLLFFALTAPWFVAVSLANPEFAYFFFVQEHWLRFTTKMHHRVEPAWFFLPVLALGAWPWLFAIAAAWVDAFRRSPSAFSPALFLGVSGYHWIEGIPWVDAILNAAMILGGMGPVAELKTTAGKLFAAGYALFSGLVFIVVAGILVGPVVHRFLHRFHLEDERKRRKP